MRVARIFLLLPVVAICLPVRCEETGFIPWPTTVGDEIRAGAVYVPEGYDASKVYPLVVFLHGSGERGDDGVVQTTVGVGKEIRENPERFPCIVYMPQCAIGNKWFKRPENGVNVRSSHDHLTVGIDQIIEKYSIDEDRVSLTGLSMGGAGTYAYGYDNAERFSAFMPVCGRGNKRYAETLANRPFWIFHGDEDSVVPLSASELMAKVLREEGGNVELAVYPGVGHGSWVRAYSKEQGAIEWLLKQKR